MKRFPASVLAALQSASIVGLRAGADPHRFIGIWVVVVNGRAFVRSWNDRPDGWRRVFLTDPRGSIQIGDRVIAIRARPVRGERLLDAIDRGYREKYNTPGSRKYVVGLVRPRRRASTTELMPRR